MPCYRCGARQVDPVRGHSPWQRGVRDDRHVLVCPDCQAGSDWTAELDPCRRCGSVRLVRRLGEVECRNCGFVVPPEDALGPVTAGGQAPGLAEEVALALERVFGRTAGKPEASRPVTVTAPRWDAASRRGAEPGLDGVPCALPRRANRWRPGA